MFVYVVAKEDQTQPWKIGRTTNPEQRMKQLQAHSPDRLVYVKIVEAHQDLEASLHRQFAEYRSHGEWFYLPYAQAASLLARLDGEENWVIPMKRSVVPISQGKGKGARPYRRATRKTKMIPRIPGGRGFRYDAS